MLFGVRTPATKPIKEIADMARRAEAAGLDGCWFPDSHLNYREVWTTLTAVALATETLRIGPTVTNLVTRHPTVTASAARALGELAPGRFFLGIGAGDSAVGFDGLVPPTVARMGQGVENLRRLLNGEMVRFGEFDAELRGAHKAPDIYVAASGPKTLAMAGRVADAVIITMGNIEQKMARIGEGAAEAGRPRPPIFIYTSGMITNDIERVAKSYKHICIRMAQLEGPGLFERAGVPVPWFDDHKMGAQGDLGHAANNADAAKAVDHLVADETALWYVRNHAVVGSEAEVEARLLSLADQGIAGVTLNGSDGSSLPDALIEALPPIIRRIRQRHPT